jgi:hypothetical protein
MLNLLLILLVAVPPILPADRPSEPPSEHEKQLDRSTLAKWRWRASYKTDSIHSVEFELLPDNRLAVWLDGKRASDGSWGIGFNGSATFVTIAIQSEAGGSLHTLTPIAADRIANSAALVDAAAATGDWKLPHLEFERLPRTILIERPPRKIKALSMEDYLRRKGR